MWLWYNSGGPHNEVMEQPRDRMHDPEIRRAEFEKLADWGVAGVKVDFFHSDKQAGIQLFWDILADAAEHRIMVNLHGCTIPRGWRRTWPHLMTMEGVRGAEQYGFDEHFPEVASGTTRSSRSPATWSVRWITRRSPSATSSSPI